MVRRTRGDDRDDEDQEEKDTQSRIQYLYGSAESTRHHRDATNSLGQGTNFSAARTPTAVWMQDDDVSATSKPVIRW